MPDDAFSLTLGHLLTEQVNDATRDIDCQSPLEIVRSINCEDASIATSVAVEIPQIALAIESIAARMRLGGRIIYLGAGTSGRLGALDAYECSPTFNIPSDRIICCIAGGSFALDQAAEDFEDDAEAGKADLAKVSITAADTVIGISASGRTPYVIGGMHHARECNALTIGLACNTPSELAQLADIMIAPIVGPEVISGSTRMKSGTAQKMILNMISTGTMILLGKTYGNLMIDVQATNRKLRKRALSIIRHITGCDDATAEEYLQQSGGDTRLAIMMCHFKEDAETARIRLAAHDGNLRAALRSVV